MPKEIERIMKIAAETLDILQGEKNVGLGYFCQPFPP
jgi:hypothetical protein